MFVMFICNNSEYENTGLIGTHMIQLLLHITPGEYSRVGMRQFCQHNFYKNRRQKQKQNVSIIEANSNKMHLAIHA